MFEGTLRTRCKYLNDDVVTMPILARFTFWPNAGGCYPFCVTDNGDSILWNPVDQCVIAVDSKTTRLETYDMEICRFWYALASQEIQPSIFPKDLWEGNHFTAIANKDK